MTTLKALSQAENAVDELIDALGSKKVITDPDAAARMLRDQSWLSPVLREDIADRRERVGSNQGVEAVAIPETLDDLIKVAASAAKHRVPLTMRGAATSNFGLLSPDEGGILLDMRKLRGDAKVLANDDISVLAGTPHGEIERTLWTVDRECPVLTTTYSNATIGGWLAGGHVGLGSGCHGAVWDDLVSTLRILTVEEQPKLIKLHGDDIHPVLHTFGAGGIIYDVVLRTEPRHHWDEVVAFFPTYEQSASFVTALSLDTTYRHRAAAAQDERLTAGQKSISTLGESGSCALLIIDHDQYDDVARLAEKHGGHLVFWQRWGLAPTERQSIASMVYGHRMLWVKQYLPTAAFAHIYFDVDDPLSGQKLLKDRFGDNVLMETKFIRSKWMAKALGFGESTPAIAASVVTIVDGNPETVHALLAACDELGLKYQSSHSNVVEDNGLFPDVTAIVEHKSKVDPYNLVNRGRLRSARQYA